MNDTTQKIIDRATTATPVTAYLDYREYLQALYAWLKQELDHYSYLSFADDLGFSRTNVLHLIIGGKRPLTVKGALRIATAIGLKGVDRRYLEVLVRHSHSRRPAEREDLFQELLVMKNRTLKSALEKSQLEYFSEWYHPIIREMMLMPQFSSDPEWIAARLTPKIRPEQARKSLDLLERLGLASYDAERKRHVPAATQVTTGDDVASLAVVSFHQRMIDLGKESITKIAEEERDVSSITVCVSEATAARIRREVRAFRKQLLALAEEAEGPDRVFQLNLQFFPVTQWK